MDDTPAGARIADRISALVAELLAGKGLPPVAKTARLRESGLSSLDMVNLMMAVEDAFHLTLPDAKMTPEHFRTIGAIETLVAELI